MMRLDGRLFTVGRYWAVEVPILGVVSQGRTRREALEMIADAIESLVDQPGFTVQIFAGRGRDFEVDARDQAALIALLLRRQRLRSGFSLADVAARLGSRSPNAYARYEQGRAAPTVQKLSELLAAVAPDKRFILTERTDGGTTSRMS
jgi:hypothetical protein